MTVLDTSFGNGDVLLWMLEFFLLVIWFWLLLSIFGDLFRDQELSGGLKAVWIFVLVLLPYIGIFIYLIARGRGMAGRSAAHAELVQQQVEGRRRATPVGAGSPADQISQAKALLDSGAINQAEYDALKARALAT